MASIGRHSRPTAPSRAPWRIHFFRRHRTDDAGQTVPARKYLDDCPVTAKLFAVIKAVAEAPPPQFAGGGKWEAMHDEMAGVYEVRVDGPRRHHYRLFCVLEANGGAVGLEGPSVVLITGMDKPFRTEFSAADYRKVRRLVDEYRSRSPRSVER